MDELFCVWTTNELKGNHEGRCEPTNVMRCACLWLTVVVCEHKQGKSLQLLSDFVIRPTVLPGPVDDKHQSPEEKQELSHVFRQTKPMFVFPSSIHPTVTGEVNREDFHPAAEGFNKRGWKGKEDIQIVWRNDNSPWCGVLCVCVFSGEIIDSSLNIFARNRDDRGTNICFQR